jgi:hypothetical protein
MDLILRSVVILTGLPLVGLAQTTSTEILGHVSDPSGAMIPNAQVKLLRVATGTVRDTMTSLAGSYSFPLIEIGEYTVTVQAPGFRTQEKKGIVVQLQQKARVDFELAVGETSERVEVVATGVELKTDDAAVGQVIDNKRVVELPLNGRNIATLAVLTPGVQFGKRQGFDGTGGNPIPGRMVAVSANGQREINQQVTIDGITANGSQVNVMVFTPSVDAIEEFKVQTSSYSAEYGQQSGAQVQISLKSGTNQLRGTVYEFLRNDMLAAEDYFLNFQLPAGTARRPKNTLRRNQFGAFVGGPVVLPRVYDGRNRTFWSFNYEGLRETLEVTREAFWFPDAFRKGDFSALLTPTIRNGQPIRAPIIIHDPVTGEPFRDSTGRITNIIPGNRIYKPAQDFINNFQPLPMFQPEDILEPNAKGPVANITKSNQVFFRIDHQFSAKDRVFVRYIKDSMRYTSLDLNPNFPRFDDATPGNWAVQHIHLFSPRVLNEFRYGWNGADAAAASPRTDTDFDLDSLGIGKFRVATDGNRPLRGRETGIPDTIIAGDRDKSTPSLGINRTHQVADNLSIVRGSHNIKTGFEIRRLFLELGSSNNPRGAIGCCLGGYNLAGWLMGYVNSSMTAEGLGYSVAHQFRSSAYVQDEWKIGRRLTANLGFRWDYFTVPLEERGGWRSLRLDVLTRASDGRMLPTLQPKPGTPDYPLHDGDNRYFMPRLGIAWRVTDKWVVRSGFGWFVNAHMLNNYNILSRNPPGGGTYSYNAITDTAQVISYSYAGRNYNIQTRRIRPGTDILTFANLFPSAGTDPARTNLILIPPDNRYTNHVQWSFDIQRALPWQAFLTVAYVGSKTSHLDNTVENFNNPDPSPDTDVNRRRPWQAFVGEGEGNTPRGLGTIRYLDSYANASYQGLQVTAEKRYSHGVVLGAAYTYSKALGEGYGRNDGGVYQNPRDRRSDRARFPFDVTHNAVIHYVWSMPFFKGLKGVPRAVLADWQTNGILTFRTGFPFSLAGGTLNTGSASRPDRVGDGRLEDPIRERWYDPTAFRRTDCNIPGRGDLCHYGNAGAYILNSPGASEFDLSFYKNWAIPPLGEASRLQFRAEFFNIFNTPQFGQPQGISFASLDSVVPDGPRNAEVRSLRLPMRVIQFGLKLYF